MKTRWENFKTWLLGPKCPRCAIRVFPKNQAEHDEDCD